MDTTAQAGKTSVSGGATLFGVGGTLGAIYLFTPNFGVNAGFGLRLLNLTVDVPGNSTAAPATSSQLVTRASAGLLLLL